MHLYCANQNGLLGEVCRYRGHSHAGVDKWSARWELASGGPSAYVAQEELYVPTLSCWETLRFHAVLRNRERASRGALKERIAGCLCQ